MIDLSNVKVPVLLDLPVLVPVAPVARRLDSTLRFRFVLSDDLLLATYVATSKTYVANGRLSVAR